jgi:hypothetical protein
MNDIPLSAKRAAASGITRAALERHQLVDEALISYDEADDLASIIIAEFARRGLRPYGETVEQQRRRWMREYAIGLSPF